MASSRQHWSACESIYAKPRRNASWWGRPMPPVPWAPCACSRKQDARDCAIVGQNGEPEARAELRSPGTRLVASVAYFPEKYGDGLIRLALDILAHKPVPPSVFRSHQVITPENVDQFYPNDSLMMTRT